MDRLSIDYEIESTCRSRNRRPQRAFGVSDSRKLAPTLRANQRASVPACQRANVSVVKGVTENSWRDRLTKLFTSSLRDGGVRVRS